MNRRGFLTALAGLSTVVGGCEQPKIDRRADSPVSRVDQMLAPCSTGGTIAPYRYIRCVVRAYSPGSVPGEYAVSSVLQKSMDGATWIDAEPSIK